MKLKVADIPGVNAPLRLWVSWNKYCTSQQFSISTAETNTAANRHSNGNRTLNKNMETKEESGEIKQRKVQIRCCDEKSDLSLVATADCGSSSKQRSTAVGPEAGEPVDNSTTQQGVCLQQYSGPPEMQPTDPSEASVAQFTADISTKRKNANSMQLSGHQTTPEPDLQKPRGYKDYYGLHNLGATCYLNVVLQTLFMTEEFRNKVESLEATGILKELKVLFGKLKKGNTGVEEELLKQLGITNKFQQQDAAEYFQKIVSIENSEVTAIFRGQMKNCTTCLKNRHENGSQQLFVTIPLAINGDLYAGETFKVVDSWKEFFKTSVLDGENQMYCDICDEKTDTEVSCEISECPKILTLHLKRFDFDYNSMMYVKNNCCVEMPLKLQVNQKHTFQLYAVINHNGNHTGGHYYAVIKSFEDHSWYQFDDSCVKPIDKNETFTSKNAYLLMYRRYDRPSRDPQGGPEGLRDAETCEGWTDCSNTGGQVEAKSHADGIREGQEVSCRISSDEEDTATGENSAAARTPEGSLRNTV
ncbi:ubiquitin carboxyl-terminal hydrolase 27-like isoform X1 [Arapaima gigas]